MKKKLSNKNNKIKAIYIQNKDSSNKRNEHVNVMQNKGYAKTPYVSNNLSRVIQCYKSLRTNNCKRSSYHKSNDTQIKIHHHGMSNSINLIDQKCLLRQKQRAEESRVYGRNACQSIFHNRAKYIVRAWFTENAISYFREVLHWMAMNHKAYHIVDNTELKIISGTEHHGGVCFLIKKRSGITAQEWIINQVNTNDCVLALEGVGNPYNLGAIIRSCAHFGVKGILLEDPALLESGAAIYAAEGGAEHVQPIVSNRSLAYALKVFSKAGYTVVATSSHADKTLFKSILPSKVVLMLGQEHNGLSKSTLSLGDFSVSINGTGNIESLNVSVATGVLLSEWWRQNKI